MTESERLRCRMVARRDAADSWSFHLVNDNEFSLEEVVLCEVRYEWGDYDNGELTDIRVTELASSEHVEIWRDDGSGVELRMEFNLRVRCGDRTARMTFEFPKLYRKKDLPSVQGLDWPGWEVIGDVALR